MHHRMVILLIATLAGCGDPAEERPIERARPVTALVLTTRRPQPRQHITGVVEPHRQEDVGFEVSGRLEFVLLVGNEVDGPSLDVNGDVIAKGDAIATIDDSRYRLAHTAASLRLESAKRALDAAVLNAEQVAPSDVKSSEAQEAAAEREVESAAASRSLALAELERVKKLVASGVVSQADLDRAQTEYESANATHGATREALSGYAAATSSAKARRDLATAEAEKARAQVAESELALIEAAKDLEDCVLYAPFSGRITATHTGRGGYVAPGSPVLTLTMMDPIKVVVTVDAEQSRRLPMGSQARLWPSHLSDYTADEALYGNVYSKSEVADPATRTYSLDLFVRNPRAGGRVRGLGAESIRAVMTRVYGETSPLFVPEVCLTEDRSAVKRLPGLRIGSPEPMDPASVIVPETVALKLGDERFTLLDWSLVRVLEPTELRAGDLLLVKPTPEMAAGVRVDPAGWALLPGALVPVSFDLTTPAEGIYVPVDAIRHRNGSHFVFEIDGDDRSHVREVAVLDSVGDLRRVECDQLEDGDRIAVAGLHYLGDGDRVVVTAVDVR